MQDRLLDARARRRSRRSRAAGQMSQAVVSRKGRLFYAKSQARKIKSDAINSPDQANGRIAEQSDVGNMGQKERKNGRRHSSIRRVLITFTGTGARRQRRRAVGSVLRVLLGNGALHVRLPPFSFILIENSIHDFHIFFNSNLYKKRNTIALFFYSFAPKHAFFRPNEGRKEGRGHGLGEVFLK